MSFLNIKVLRYEYKNNRLDLHIKYGENKYCWSPKFKTDFSQFFPIVLQFINFEQFMLWLYRL